MNVMSHPNLLMAALTATLLAACGGGSNTPAAPEQVLITGRAVDGPLAGATACYDLNDNGACDSGEPQSGPTAPDGSFTIAVAPAAAGRHAVVVEVPATAVDADTGTAVGRAFTMRAPATGASGGHAVFVSPLTTLVHAHMAASGVALDAASALVQQQAGLAFSPLADFTQDNSAAALQAARVARLAQLTKLAQQGLLDGLVGAPNRDGQPISEADIERELNASLVGALPLVAGTLTDVGLQAATGRTLQALLGVAARSLALQLDVNADAVRTASSVSRLAEPPASAYDAATGSLVALRYTNSENFFYRMLESSVADNVADSNGYRRFYEYQVAGTPNTTTGTSVTTAGVVAPGTSNNVYWNGSAWVTRALNDRNQARVPDAQGRGDYVNGGGLESGTSVRRFEDIAGQSLSDVVRRKIRLFPGSNSGVAFANWGPSDLSLYGTATFPAGSLLQYFSQTATNTAIQYNPASTNRVTLFSAAVAAGGDSAVNTACVDPAQTSASAAVPATSLEEMMARLQGTPCVVPPVTGADASLVPNEQWYQSSASLGTLANTNALPAGTGNYYTTSAVLRVRFQAGTNRVQFLRCYGRNATAALNSARNCSVLGLGTWNIQTLGDARVLGFSVAPALAQRLGYARYFVERGGAVYFGSKNPVGVTTTFVRLNLTAANAVFQQLGLPRRKPITQPGTATGARAATLATLEGAWGEAGPTEAIVFRFGPNGRYFMASAKPLDSFFREQTGAELGWMDYDPAGRYFSALIEVDSNLTSGFSHPNPSEMFQAFTVTPTQITGDVGTNLTRLPTDTSNTSLVGMWGFGSATDLSVPHLVFFSNGKFMLITHSADPQCVGTNQCPPGVEYSDYTYNATTGTLNIFNPLYDTNGCDGAFATCAAGSNNTSDTVNVVIAPDGQTAVLTSDVVTTLYRIAPQASNQILVTSDASVDPLNPNLNTGSSADLTVGRVLFGNLDQLPGAPAPYSGSLLQFDHTRVPSNSTRVLLNVYIGAVNQGSNFATDIVVNRVTQAWTESALTFNTRPAIDINTVFGSVAWPASNQVGWAQIDITTLVRGWQQGTFSNFGLVLRTNEFVPFAVTERVINSRNASSNQPYVSFQ